MRPMKFGVGQPIRRVEDQRLTTGMGRYTDDTAVEGALHGFVLRSQYAHATFTIRDKDVARKMKGVKLVLTGEDVAHLGGLPCKGLIASSSGEPVKAMPVPVLPLDTVRHVGEAVAFIVAETLEQARDAAEAIDIAWDALPSITGISEALADGAPLVWPDRAGNVAFEAGQGDAEKTEKAFAKADRTVSVTIVNNRLASNYLETRACIAEYDKADKRWTLTMGSQGSHNMREILADYIFKVAHSRIRVVTPDVGGGFGTKLFMYREYPLTMVAAEMLKRPVRWVSDRTEHFLADTHGRANLATATMALDKKGKFIGLKVDLRAEMGAWLSQYGPFIPWVGTTMTPGCYDIPAVHVRIRGVLTNTTPVDAYRGAGRPEAAYLIERLVDAIARETGKTPDAVRALNFVKPESMPHKTQTGPVYDSGEFEGHMRRAMDVADWKGFKARLKSSTKAGKIRGIGLACYIEACGGGGPESSTVILEKDGMVTVLIGTQSNGQGHETAYSQLVAQHLDIPLDRVRVIQGDTDKVATGAGTGGSRSIPVGGAALDKASSILTDNLKQLASEKLEAGIGDLEIVNGAVKVVGTDRGIDLAAIAALPGATPELLKVHQSWQPPEATYPNGTHVCELEVDPSTGATEILNYIVVDDFGMTLNPMMLAGQVHGGAAQGIGQALMEEIRFDESGQMLTATFMDYALPRAVDIPNFHFETRNVRCVTNAIGVKGAGEAGAIGSCPAVMNAMVDALNRAAGISAIDMPATPNKVFGMLKAAGYPL
ncbi:xanthine dehydrogenase family protein molybdopterin-binding subunit [Bosea caraganae]|uniref:Xanthine dehydrogenase family protein molybdopterin-binding subunit n=1 Tax=Bosea caraganae TaxID=2763117 RepID=A0A370LB65_9HYPH|nr:xanthine dehydrogenase family protein molybdopterin-binding subunit [Bosea caraganae]RDJ27195.1 xanthine dehydrogenase family protein molybdopterin-binding subunit [Bosea caraganae]RDJ29212.1 xanthine dehydrogenase family protein molybdopterin-binding subunit [Bosea caraganae]